MINKLIYIIYMNDWIITDIILRIKLGIPFHDKAINRIQYFWYQLFDTIDDIQTLIDLLMNIFTGSITKNYIYLN